MLVTLPYDLPLRSGPIKALKHSPQFQLTNWVVLPMAQRNHEGIAYLYTGFTYLETFHYLLL